MEYWKHPTYLVNTNYDRTYVDKRSVSLCGHDDVVCVDTAGEGVFVFRGEQLNGSDVRLSKKEALEAVDELRAWIEQN